FLTFDHGTNKFEIFASGTVNQAGTTIVTDPGSGLSLAGWGGNCPPYAVVGNISGHCDLYPNGCGPSGILNILIPDCWPIFVEDECGGVVCFTPACDCHDICWTTCGASQLACDIEFLAHLTLLCVEAFDPDEETDCFLRCEALAFIYFTAVALSTDHYLSNQLLACSCPLPVPPPMCMLPSPDGSGYFDLGGMEPPYDDADRDLLPDVWEVSVGLSPNDPSDVLLDNDLDGLTNLEEFIFDSNPFVVDSDDDGVDDQTQAEALQPKSPPRMDEQWTVSANGQTVPVDPYGRFFMGNVAVPDNFGVEGPGSPADGISDDFIRVVATSSAADGESFAYSDCFKLAQDDTRSIEELTFGDAAPPDPESISIALQQGSSAVLLPGETSQLSVISYPGGIELSSECTSFRSSNADICEVDAEGQVSANSIGDAVITAVNAGATAAKRIQVVDMAATTTIEGYVQFEDGTPASGAMLTTLIVGGGGLTDAAGFFRYEVTLPSNATSVTVVAELKYDGANLIGTAAGLEVFLGGVTDAGIMTLGPSCTPSWSEDFNHPGVNNSVHAAAVFDDDNGPLLYVAGQFTNVGDLQISKIARWNGVKWSDVGGGVSDSGHVYALAVFDTGNGPELYAGGSFDAIGGTTANRIARWNGTQWRV
ncbi:MAG: Ig-like domain-containing protein, partial [Phycisphaerae bacterium]